MKVMLFCFITIVLIFGCAEEEGQSSNIEASEKSQNSNDPIKSRKIYACYNVKSPKTCLKKINKLNLKDPRKNYKYPNSSSSQYRTPRHFVDLRVAKPNIEISNHFKVRELMSEYKGRYGVFSNPVLGKIQKIRNKLRRPIKLNSAYRSPSYNKSVGGARLSRHMYGDAIDFKVNGVSLSKLSRLCKKMGAGFTRIYRTHIHCDWRTTRLDSNFYGSSFHSLQNEEDVNLYYTENSRIIPKIKFSTNQKAVLNLSYLSPQEDGGQLHVEWLVTGPKGLRMISNQHSLSLPPIDGSYYVKAKLGGSVHVEANFEVNKGQIEL